MIRAMPEKRRFFSVDVLGWAEGDWKVKQKTNLGDEIAVFRSWARIAQIKKMKRQH